MTRLLLGKIVADSMAEDIKSCASMYSNNKLVTIGFDEPAWQQYAVSIGKSAEKYGFTAENIIVSAEITFDEFCNIVENTSQRSDLCGVLLQQPLPKGFENAVNFVDKQKDVDCLCKENISDNVYLGGNGVCPATPTAVIKLLDYYGIDIAGKNVVIIGRGGAVGKPLSLMMLKHNATVTICHTKTKDVASLTRNADIIVSACGVPGLVSKEYVTENSVIIDVGLSFKDGKTCGDVSQDVYDIVSAVSPVPGGVGPVTRACLFNNLLTNLKNYDNKRNTTK